jgi:hypothetical protein
MKSEKGKQNLGLQCYTSIRAGAHLTSNDAISIIKGDTWCEWNPDIKDSGRTVGWCVTSSGKPWAFEGPAGAVIQCGVYEQGCDGLVWGYHVK